MALYYFELDTGCCGIHPAVNLQHAKREMERDEGRNHLVKIRRATKADLDWVEMMGGQTYRDRLR